MLDFFKGIAYKFGVDKSIFFTSSARIFQASTGLVTVLLVASCLTGAEQGFYFTFSSILAIQIFFELGMSSIITQFVAHENANLSHRESKIEGSEYHLSRLSALLHFCLKWYAIFAILILVIISIAGYFFFSYFYTSSEVVNWQFPWFLLVVGTALNFMLAPISSYLEGLGKVKEIAYIRLLQGFFAFPLVWLCLFFDAKLYTSMVVPIVNFFVFVFLCWRQFGKLLINIFRIKITYKVSYITEIFPYQWRIALSWISGYFIFQLFNPVIFAFDGAEVAGQMGMTLTILNNISALAMSWTVTKVPLMSTLIAKKKYNELDNLFNRTLRQQILIAILALLLFFVTVVIFRFFDIKIWGNLITNRLLPYIPMLLMMFTIVINQYVGSIATYLRCHKQEPFMVNSIIGGISCMLSTIIFGKYFGVIGVTAGYCLITLLLLPWGHYIYVTKKKQWHMI